MTSHTNPRPSPPTTTPFSPQTYRQGEQPVISSIASTQSIRQQPNIMSTSAPRPFVPRRFNTGTSPGGHPGHAIQGHGSAQPSHPSYYSGQESSHGFYPHASYQQQHSHATTHHPPHASGVPSHTGLEETKLTERGQEFPFKSILMARYQQMESLGQFPPMQFLSSEASLVGDGVIIGDVHARQPLASTMPFNSEELGAIATGQFVHHQQRRPGGSQHHHAQRKEYTHTRTSSYNKHAEEEEEEILWGAEPIQTGQLGTFDASGQFVATTRMAPPLKPIIPTSSLGTLATEPSTSNLPRTTKTLSDFSPAVPPGFGPVLPIITSSTQWVYRDPVGNLQGPFLNGKMLEWYQAGYFPDNLPIRRDTDSFFDTLSAWRLKCGGRVPFEATSPIDIRASGNTMQEIKTDSGQDTGRQRRCTPRAVDSKARQTSESERFLAGLVTGKLDTSLGEEPKRAIPIEQLEAHIKPTVIKKDSPTILQRPMGPKETSEETVQTE